MSFTSKAEICKKFNIDSSLDPAQIIKELTMLQAEIHPDRKLDYTDTDHVRFTLLAEAKSFLRETPEDNQAALSSPQNHGCLNKFNHYTTVGISVCRVRTPGVRPTHRC